MHSVAPEDGLKNTSSVPDHFCGVRYRCCHRHHEPARGYAFGRWLLAIRGPHRSAQWMLHEPPDVGKGGERVPLDLLWLWMHAQDITHVQTVRCCRGRSFARKRGTNCLLMASCAQRHLGLQCYWTDRRRGMQYGSSCSSYMDHINRWVCWCTYLPYSQRSRFVSSVLPDTHYVRREVP